MQNRVLIAGAGPTGLTAALELSRLGVPVRIIDKQVAPATTSRAVGVQARTLELFEMRGRPFIGLDIACEALADARVRVVFVALPALQHGAAHAEKTGAIAFEIPPKSPVEETLRVVAA